MTASATGRGNGRALPSPVMPSWDRCDLAGLLGPLRGRRVILVNAEGSHHDFRAVSDLETDLGAQVVWVATDVNWWNHTNLALPLQKHRWPAAAVWVEVWT